MEMKNIIVLMIMISLPLCLSSVGRKKSDPGYTEEFNQVYDAKLSCSIMISCEIKQDLKTDMKVVAIVLTMLKAIGGLNFHSIDLFVCPDKQNSFRQTIEPSAPTTVIRNLSEISTIKSDLLIFVGSSFSRDFTKASGFSSNVATNTTSRRSADVYRTNLTINLNLNFQAFDMMYPESVLIYDIVMLLSRAEVFNYLQSWSLLQSQLENIMPVPEIFMAEASATAWQMQLQQSAVLNARGSKHDLLHHRNNTISIFLSDITSSSFNATFEAEYFSRAISTLRTTWVSSVRQDSRRIGDVHILWRTNSDDLEAEKIYAAVDLLKSAVLAIFDLKTLGDQSEIHFFRYNPSEFFNTDNGRYNSEKIYSNALRESSILWVRLPLVKVISQDFVSPVLYNVSSNRKNTTRLISTIEEGWDLLRHIEALVLEAKLFGCISFLDVSNNITPGSIDRNYGWLVDNRNSYIVHNSDELVMATLNKVFFLSPKKQNQLRLAAIGKQYDMQSTEAVEEFKRVVLDGLLKSTFRHFIQKKETMILLRNLTNSPIIASSSISKSHSKFHRGESGSLVPSRRNSYPKSPLSLQGTYFAVIIEPRMDPAFEFCVRNVMYHLGNTWNLLVLHSTGPLGNEQYVRRSLLGLTNVSFQAADSVTDGDSYNTLVKGPSFWKNLEDRGISKVFIFQTDSIMIRHGIEEFLHWDYIGAPWNMQRGAASGVWLKRYQRSGILLEGVGNGGTSLRTVSVMLKIAEKYANKGNGGFNEDTFFAHNCEKMSREMNKFKSKSSNGCKLATRESAYSFAVEMPLAPESINMTITPLLSPDDFNSSNPNGMKLFIPLSLHCTWAYINPILFLQLLELSIT